MTQLVWPAIESPALAVVAYIVEGLWEGLAVVALAALVIRLFRRANATTRYAIWYIALIAIIVLPALTVVAMTVVPHALAQGPRIALPHAVTLVGAALWSLGALAGLLRIAVGYAALAKLQRDALPLPPGYREAMPLWEDSIGRGRETRLCVSSNVAVPVAVGLFDGMILMPDHLLESFDRADVDRFSLHEIAHLQRRDDWTCALERIACAVLFFNPAVRWVSRQLDLEREVACDDWVVAQTREVRPYAVGLTKMAEATKWPHRAVPTPAIFASRKSISIRIERLLNKHRDVRPTLAGGPALACCAAIVIASAVLLPIAPVIGNVTAPVPVVATAAKPAAAAKAARHRAAATPAKRTTANAAVVAANAFVVAANAAKPKASARTPLAAKPDVKPAPAKPAHPAAVSPGAGVVAVVVSPRHRAAASAPAARAAQAELADLRHRLASVRVTVVPDPDVPTIAPLPAARLELAPRRLAQAAPAPNPQPQPRHGDYLDALTAAGYDKLTADEIIALHDNGVSPTLIIASSRYFPRRITVRDLVALQSSGVSAAYLDELNRNSLRTAPNDVVAFTLNGVSAPYAAVVLHAYPQLTPSSVILLMRNGVSSRLVWGLRERGYAPTLSEIIELAQHGVSLQYVEAVNAHRGTRMNLTEIVKLHDHGVSADAN